jgi:hypothetical protein
VAQANQTEHARIVVDRIFYRGSAHVRGVNTGQQHGRNLDQAIATTESSLQEAIKELRTFSYLMHPLALQQQGLHGALSRNQVLPQCFGDCLGSIAYAELGLRLLQVTADGLLPKFKRSGNVL